MLHSTGGTAYKKSPLQLERYASLSTEDFDDTTDGIPERLELDVALAPLRQLLRLRNRVQPVARLPEHRADLRRTLREGLHRVLAVVE